MKVTVVGAGAVGATCADNIARKELATELVLLDRSGKANEARGRLASRVAEALEWSADFATKPTPLEVTFDNNAHDRYTVLDIRGEDSINIVP